LTSGLYGIRGGEKCTQIYREKNLKKGHNSVDPHVDERIIFKRVLKK